MALLCGSGSLIANVDTPRAGTPRAGRWPHAKAQVCIIFCYIDKNAALHPGFESTLQNPMVAR